MQKREGRSFAPPPTIPARPDLGRTGRKGLPPLASLPPLTSALSRRAALFGAVTVAGVTATAVVPAMADAMSPSPDARLIARADAFRALREREHRAWDDLDEDAADDGPEIEACRALSDELRDAGDALAEMPAVTTAGLGAKAAAMLTLVGARLDTQANLMEHDDLVVSVLRDAARLGTGNARALPLIALAPAGAAPSRPTSAERRLGTMADQLDALQTRADGCAAGAGSNPADPYTLTVAEIDLVAAGMAGLPADTLGGVLLKLRAMQVPIVRDDDEAHGLALSVCRDLRRLRGTEALS